MKIKLTDFTLDYNGKLLAVKAPMSLYSTLLQHGEIPDPYVGTNAREAAELSRGDYDFYTSVEVSEGDLERKRAYLCFEGLDTLCTVFVNGKKVGYADNMHRTWLFDAKGLLFAGKNEIKLHFHSPIEYIEALQKRKPLVGNADTHQGFPYLRKAYSMLGWDWCNELADMGVFRDAYVCFDDGVCLEYENVSVTQKHNKDGSVILTVKSDLELPVGYGLEAKLSSPDGRIYEAEMKDGAAELAVSDPMLWWPNGFGEQYLYSLTVTLTYMGKEVSVVEKNVGIRTVELNTQNDSHGKEFNFTVNGKPIFCRGANYIPEDNILPYYSYERTEQMIEKCIEANFNMLRVWGGGLYPHNYFMDICDRRGILVWVDCMFSCTTLWLTEELKRNIVEELRDNMRRLGSHACLALLCGNNECEEGIAHWAGFTESLTVKEDYIELFEHIIPDLANTYAPDSYYWPSSPSAGGGFDKVKNVSYGDSHIWTVWSAMAPIEEYTKIYPRFLSEFGYCSMPSKKALDRISSEKEDRNLFSEVMDFHQKHLHGNSKILKYIAHYYRYPETFESLAYASQLMQAYAMKTGVEHLRRYRDVCRGALYWQLNDCWPGISWSSLDYLGEPKALHFAAKRFYAPVLPLATKREGSTTVVFGISNEGLSHFDGRLEYSLIDRSFEKLYENSISISASPLSAADLLTVDFGEMIKGREKRTILAYTLYGVGDEVIYRGSLIFTPAKYFEYGKPDIRITAEAADGGFILSVSSDTYAESVSITSSLDADFKDNFFSVTSSAPVTVPVKTALSKKELLDSLSVISVYDLGR